MVDLPSAGQLSGSYIEQIKYKLKIYKTLMIIFAFLSILFLINVIVSEENGVSLGLFSVCVLITSMLTAMTKKLNDNYEDARAALLRNELDAMARSESLSAYDLDQEIIKNTGTDMFVNLQACKYFPGWCGVDAAGNVLELAACKSDPNSRECKNAKAAVKTIEVPAEVVESAIKSTVESMDKQLHAKGVFSGATYDALAAKAGQMITTDLVTFTGEGAVAAGEFLGLEGMGLAGESLLAATGPIGLAVGGAIFAGQGVYEGYEACRKSKACREFTNKVKKDTINAIKRTTMNEVKAYHDVEDAFGALAKGKFGKFAKNMGDAFKDSLGF